MKSKYTLADRREAKAFIADAVIVDSDIDVTGTLIHVEWSKPDLSHWLEVESLNDQPDTTYQYSLTLVRAAPTNDFRMVIAAVSRLTEMVNPAQPRMYDFSTYTELIAALDNAAETIRLAKAKNATVGLHSVMDELEVIKHDTRNTVDMFKLYILERGQDKATVEVLQDRIDTMAVEIEEQEEFIEWVFDGSHSIGVYDCMHKTIGQLSRQKVYQMWRDYSKQDSHLLDKE